MRAVILAGGLGMRLRPYTAVLPKPLIPVGDRPVIEHILRRLTKFGITRVDFCVAHLGELIRVYLSEATDIPSTVECNWHWEDQPLGTAGALNVIPDLDGTFLVMNGDILTTIDFGELLEVHRESGALLTIAMHAAASRYRSRCDREQRRLHHRLHEKPTLLYDVSMGIYVYEKAALSYLPDGPCQFPDLVQRLIDAGERVAAYRSDAEWFDIGTFPEYERAGRYIEEHPAAFAA